MTQQPTSTESPQRRPLKSRGSAWAQMAAKLLLRTSITPNAVSVASVGFAAVGAYGLLHSGSDGAAGCLFLAIAGMQLRLLCNLLDGLIAVEGGRATADGALYNEVPDRIADVIILLAAGYGYNSHPIHAFPPHLDPSVLGWIAALLAVSTAYVRALGASVGGGECFCGPMAKPHRMALLTGAAVLELVCSLFGGWTPFVPTALAFMIAGCVVTLYRRISAISAGLRSRPS